jgi:hypothetical protein
MTYPAIVLSLALAVITVLMVFVLPALVHLFSEFNADLPLPSKSQGATDEGDLVLPGLRVDHPTGCGAAGARLGIRNRLLP